ncbi:MAG: Hsp33 family molecular chaperone HslO [Lachnospiraceae bacterium]
MSDVILRATAANAQIRAFVADTRELVQYAFERHHTYPVASAALGRTLTAAAIMGTMQKSEQDELTIIFQGDGPLGKMTVTADANANVKGYVCNPALDIPLKANGKLDVSGAIGAGNLTVIKDMGLKEPYVGTVPLQTGEIAEDLTYYFMASEQIPSSVGLGVLVDRDLSIKCAGGFILQLMPFASDEVIDRLEQNLSKVSSVTKLLESGNAPEDILAILLEGLDPVVNDKVIPHYACNCSKERISHVLSSLGKSDMDEMIADGKTIEVHCDFCNQFYYFEIEELKEIRNHM